MSSEIQDIKMEVMKPEMMLESDKSKGINQPGLTQGVTYVDCNGNTRHKYETLEVLSNRGITKKVEADEKDAEDIKDETVEKLLETSTETPTPEESEDIVAADVVEAKEEVEEEKPEVKPIPKTTAKTTAAKTTTKSTVKKAAPKKTTTTSKKVTTKTTK